MKHFVYRHWPFLAPYLLLWLVTGVLQLVYSQSYIIVTINSLWTPAFDRLFSNGTHLGDRLFVLGVVLLLLLFSYRRALLVTLTYIISGLIVQFCKIFVFEELARPWSTMAKVAPWLHKVEGTRMYENSSFPSGHTTAAFAVFTMLALFIPNPWLKALCLLPAVVVAYSRLYLLQHFPIDVHTGSLLGVLTSVVFYLYLENRWELHPKAWHRRGLLS